MIPPPRRLLLPLAAFAASAATSPILRAHPGHDDGHELTWDFSHLAAYPLATVGCAAVLVGAAAVAWRLARRSRDAAQSLRGSQRSLGK